MCKCSCLYRKKIASGEILVQKIKGYVYNYDAETPGELADNYAHIVDSAMRYSPKEFGNNTSVLRTVGYFAATIDKDGNIIMTASFCIPDDFHRFCACHGKNLACEKLFVDNVNRQDFAGALKYQQTNIINGKFEPVVYVMPYTLAETYEYFKARCLRYFKGCKFDIE